MFRKYGLIGLFLIIFAEFTMFLRIEPFINWFVVTVWYGYIFLVDSIVYILKGKSIIVNHPKRFVGLIILSIFLWVVFEFYNLFLEGWYYVNVAEPRWLHFVLAFSTILPAVMETFELVRQFHFFDKIKIKIKIPTNKYFLNTLIILGVLFLVIPIFFNSTWMWTMVWFGFILVLDPINYLFHNEKSIIMQIKKKKFNTILSIFLAGYICGFLWEFWNYWAHAKWYYTIPVLENIRIFEIPAIGFLAYGFFALELYTMYHFAKLLFSKRIFG